MITGSAPTGVDDPAIPGRFAIVAVGASAGGLDACSRLLDALPRHTGMAVIIVQHLDPHHDSLMAPLLARHTGMAVVEATPQMPLQPDRVHIIPPGHYLALVDDMLQLSPPPAKHGARLPFDFLLASLAGQGARVAAIILSGTGNDGSTGLIGLHRAGGLVIVQAPEEAEQAGMPTAAIATRQTDMIVPIAAMPAALATYDPLRGFARQLRDAVEPVANIDPTEPPFDAILAQVRKASGQDFSLYKPGTLKRRTLRRMAMAGLADSSFDRYLARLVADPDEAAALATDLLINVTGFFRDAAVFARLEQEILPALLAGKPDGVTLRLWSAGCSSGEEAYSLAMLLREAITATRRDIALQIFASDSDGDAISEAREGLYAADRMKGVAPARRARFFSREGASFRVRPELRAMVTFARHNVLDDPPFSRLDLILCRNLMIYLQNEAQLRLADTFDFALLPDGLLLLGSAEAIDSGNPRFHLVNKAARLYRHNGAAAPDGAVPAATADAAPVALPATPALTATSAVALGNAAVAGPGGGAAPSPLPEVVLLRQQLAAALAEQQAVSDEALSIREEFQATNEEMLASKEELQSLNEELTALNGQLHETLERQRTTSTDLQNVLFSTDVATLFLDRQLKIRFFTPATQRLFHLIAGDVGRPFGDLSVLAADRALPRDATRVLADEQPIEREIEVTPGHWFLRRVTPYRASDQSIEGVVVTFADVSARHRVAAALTEAKSAAQVANLAKSRFLAAASHDLRQPLQTLTLLHGLIARSVGSGPAATLVTRLGDTVDTMTVMLNAVLDINRIEAGRILPEPVELSVRALLRGLRDEFNVSAAAKGIAFHVVAPDIMVRSDPVLLRQMLRNLLSNALKYTSRGRVLLGCRRAGEALRFEIWDTGAGIPAEAQNRIFEEYYQIGHPTHDAGGGLGLGLSIVRRLGLLLDHEVTLRSAVSRGSVFCVTVPMPAPAASAVLPAPPRPMPTLLPKPPAAAAAAPSGLVLIVDDDPEIVELLELVLGDAGYRTLTARSAAQGVEVVGRSGAAPDLVLADFNLPDGRDGLSMVAQLRGMRRTPLPALVITGDVSTRTMQAIADAGCLQLSKPVTVPALLAKVAALIAPVAATPSGDSRRVWLIDDDDPFRQTLSEVLTGADFVVADFESSEAFLAGYRPGGDACLLIDAGLPGLSGLGLLAQLRGGGDMVPAIVITGRSDVKMAVAAMKAGAIDFIEKPVGADELVARLDYAFGADRDRAASDDRRADAAARLALLSSRQHEVMTMVLAGAPSKNIAADLGISQRTVEAHRAAIMLKTGCKSLPALARLAMLA